MVVAVSLLVAVLAAVLRPADGMAMALVLAAIFGTIAAAQAYRLRDLTRRIAAVAPGKTTGAIEGLDRVAALLASFDHRLTQRHPVSGLPTREPLFARIDADGGQGLIGILFFADYERLAAFDPALADRVLATLIGRVRDMVGDGPMIAHVDRARLAFWYGSAIAGDSARAELSALTYALGGMVRDGEHEVLPDVRLGTAQGSGGSASALLTRGMAALGGAVAATVAVEDPIEAARRDFEIEQGLRQAIARDEFELVYQPLIDADAARAIGAEALLRWRHPTLGAISPARFIPIAEAAGLADEVGLWVLNAACREAKAWQRLGIDTKRVAVNVSGHQLRRPDMRALVERTLGRHGLSPDRLEIELTETIATGDIDLAGALFESLRGLGVSIAIDDFGTGYSSLSALRRLSFDKLKIDREFVTDVHRRRDSQAICQSMVALARGLGIRVLAEGVETVEEFAWLRRHGCNHFQGYYFSPPLGAAEFVSFVRDTDRIATLAAGGATIERQSA